MYKDIISYKLADNVTEDKMLAVAKKVLESWMRNQKGFVKWEIHKNSEGYFTDIISWESKEDAKNSEKDMANIPNSEEWFACYAQGSQKCEKLNRIGEFK